MGACSFLGRMRLFAYSAPGRQDAGSRSIAGMLTIPLFIPKNRGIGSAYRVRMVYTFMGEYIKERKERLIKEQVAFLKREIEGIGQLGGSSA